MTTPSLPGSRRLHLDWLRVGATLLVVGYHCARPFDTEWWHVKNVEQSALLTRVAQTASLWLMPFFFFLSGIATRLALQRRSVGRILADRARRLLVPFVFGVLVIVPPQVYVERLLGRGLEGPRPPFQGSYLAFYPHYFDGLYAFGGNFSWIGHHLWYLGLLFVLTLAVLPWAAPALRWPGLARLERRGGWLAGVVLLAAIELGVDGTPLAVRALGGWSVAAYPAFLLLGLLMGTEGWEETFRRDAVGLAVIAVLAVVIGAFDPLPAGVARLVVQTLLRDTASLAGIVAMIGLGKRFWAERRRGLATLGSLVMPVYVLHQTVIVLLAYLIVPLTAPWGAKYALLFAGMALVVAPLALVVARAGWLAVLFGNPRPVVAAAPRAERVEAS